MTMLHDIFATFAKCNGLVYRHIDGDLTYSELYVSSCLLAHNLLGLKANGPILIYGHKDRRYLIAIWACLLSGLPFVPCESELSPQLVARLAHESQAVLILDVRSYPDTLIVDFMDIDVLRIEVETRSISTTIPNIGPIQKRLQDDCYIMFSSGTTGRPKGIRISLANLLDFVLWVRDLDVSVDHTNAITSIVRFSFDVSHFEMWLAWHNLSTLVSVDQRDFINTRKVIMDFQDANLSAWVSTPSVAAMYLRDPHFTSATLANLKTFIFCGEVLPKSVAFSLRDRFPFAKIINTYGPTECTVAVTAVEIHDEHLHANQELPIGYARRGTRLYCHGNMCEQSGEIIIDGMSVGNGYLDSEKRDGLMNSSFSGSCYRTGDYGYSSEDGLWYFIGRRDRELKVGGVRVSLDQCVSLIREMPFVVEVMVEPQLLNGFVRCLCAYVCGPSNQSELKSIAQALETVLHPQTIPRFWFIVSEFNISSSGKAVAPNGTMIAKEFTYVYRAPRENFS